MHLKISLRSNFVQKYRVLKFEYCVQKLKFYVLNFKLTVQKYLVMNFKLTAQKYRTHSPEFQISSSEI